MFSAIYNHDETAPPPAGAPIPTTGLVLYEGSDAQRIHQQVAVHFAPHLMRRGAGRELAAQFRLVHRGEVSLYVLSYGTDVEITTTAGDFYRIHLAHTGAGGLIVNGRATAFSPVITGPGDHVVQHWTADTVALVARIPRHVVDSAVAKQIGERPRTPVRFTTEIDRSAPLARRWLALARDFSDSAAVGMLHRSRFVQTHFEQMLVHGLLSGQPHSLTADLARPSTMPASLRRAMDFCETHARENITVTDIADAAQTSVRRLQELFRAHLRTTPLTFLRRLRLAHAHDELVALANGEQRGNVTEIATRWGFTHLGRFGVLYRQVYGTVPSRTAKVGWSPPTEPRAAEGASR